MDKIFFTQLENLLKKFQLWFMKSKRTTEQISNTQIRFHPFDWQKKVLQEYKEKLKKQKISF